MATTKADHAKRVLDAVRKEFGQGSATLLRDDEVQRPSEVIPTGLEVHDHYVLGVGGLPVGRVIELYSEEGAGKTSLGHTYLAAAQRVGGVGALMETEHAFDPTRSPVFGVRNEDLLLLQPDHLGDVLAQIEGLCKTIKAQHLGPSVLVWDSVAATPTKAEFEGGVAGDAGHGADRARDLSRAMRILTKRVSESRLVLVCINQVRENIGVMFGDQYTTAGGKAIKFHASVRLQLLGGKAVKGTHGEHVAKDVTLMSVKNRLAPPFRKARLRLNYEEGWDNDWSTLDHAKTFGAAPAKSRVGARTLEAARKKLGWPQPGDAA